MTNVSASCSQPRITESRGDQLNKAASTTPRVIQWQPYVSEWHTYDAIAPLEIRQSQVTRKATSGNRYEGTTSDPPSEPSSEQQARRSNLPRQKSVRIPSVQGGGDESLHGAGGPRHHPPGGEVAERHDAPLPPTYGKEFHQGPIVQDV